MRFVVPTVGSGNTVTLVPQFMNMLVGETRSIQAFGVSGAPISGLTWVSSDTTIATLSTDDPPVITAIAAGHVTITADDASADLTVYAGSSLPVGTVIWSAPDDGSGVSWILPAVPSPSGVADVFALQGDGNVQAITSDGAVAWTENVGTSSGLVSDFQGGLVVVQSSYGSSGWMGSVNRLDGVTGQAYPAYNFPAGYIPWSTLVHTDGTIFQLLWDGAGVDSSAPMVAGIDPLTGQAKFSVQVGPQTGGGNPANLTTTNLGNMMIAGDGYAYIPYLTVQVASTPQDPTCWWCVTQFNSTTHQTLSVMRVGSAGDSATISLGDWTSSSVSDATDSNGMQTAPVPNISLSSVTPITNTDTGVLISWEADYGAYCPTFAENRCVGLINSSTAYNLSTTSGTLLASQASMNMPGQTGAVQPVLQAQDGSFVGVVSTDSGTNSMVGFDGAGNVRWSVPNYWPAMATANGGLVAQSADGMSGLTLDAGGNATGITGGVPLFTWKGAYRYGSVDSMFVPAPTLAPTFAAIVGGNFTGNGTGQLHHYIDLFWCGTGYAEMGSCSGVGGQDILWKYVPNVSINNFGNSTDFSSTHPEWVNLIEGSAFTALRRAFSQFPVTVDLATEHETPWWQCIRHLQLPGCNQVLKIFISGVYPGDSSTGETTGLTPLSFVYYWKSLENSQNYLNSTPLYPPQTNNDQRAFQQLLRAVGTGLGNSAAHEIAHQVDYKLKTGIADCNKSPTIYPCAGGDNDVFEYYAAGKSFYADVYPAIHWQNQANGSICAIHQFFDERYRDSNCTVDLLK